MDRSGSMSTPMNSERGSQLRIASAKETLILLLKSLPLGCYFNIYGFGSTFDSFFPESVEYTQKSMEEALQRVKALEADLGGTEILEPLKNIYSKPCRPNHPRQVRDWSWEQRRHQSCLVDESLILILSEVSTDQLCVRAGEC
ncbi:von Willebrand factor A domain-containing protein 5A-like [Gracilinanus agilis]|uniref:von Willebrand factor A domain-containing protein 5A-like n=1 Tax=Gracilinanus agilis TaxID=191870 RepID=UPI001CFF33FB|nr:von Willebrand factor A domain-containing protein 5A-like [Gracilinanus agilis]